MAWPVAEPPLAELHLHTYGTVRPDDYLACLVDRPDRDVDWSYFERGYQEAYGTRPPIRDILARHAAGDRDAASDFARLFVFGDEDAGNFARFQAKFNLLINGSAIFDHIVNRAPIDHAIAEFDFFAQRAAARHRAQGVAYSETRMMLARMPAKSCARFYAGALARIDGLNEPGHTTRLAVSLPRDDPFPQWRVVRELALGPHGHCLTGIDFCFVEEGFPPRDMAPLFAEVEAFNRAHPERALAVLYHVGESFEDKSLESAIRWVQEVAELGAHRLGHAIALGVDPSLYGEHSRSESAAERRDQIRYDLTHAAGLRACGVAVDMAALQRELASLRDADDTTRIEHTYDESRLATVRARQGYAMARIRATGAVVEVCPTSNRRIGDIADDRCHPLHRFVEESVPFVVSSDDPGTFDTDLAHELAWVEAQVGPEVARTARARAWRCRSEVLTGREHP